MPRADPDRLRAWLALWRTRFTAYAGRDGGEILAISAEALSRYRLRTALSVLGVILGVAAVIAMMSVGEGARQDTLQQMELLGLNNIVVRGRGVDREQRRRWPYGLVARDARVLAELVPLVVSASPLVERFLPVAGPVGRRRFGSVLGVVANYASVLRLPSAQGRFIGFPDEVHQAAVCVIGAQLARALFGYRDPIAQHVTIDGRPYRVVGVLAGRTSEAGGIGSLPSRNLNQAVLVPLPTLLSRSLELDPRQTVTEIWLHISDGSRVSDIGPIVERTLLRLHRGVADSEVVIPRELLRQRYRTQRTFSVVVGSVAALSLLVGGIGIMNIMLASVLERTREIGIRRTVGATRRDITLQFLVESLLMTMSGGAVGIVSGILVSWGITAYAGWTTRLSLLSVVLGFGVSVLVGVIFGLYPARKAAALQPIDALRYE